MGAVKNYGAFLISLLVALIVLHFVLKMSGKLPVIGGFAERAQELAQGE